MKVVSADDARGVRGASPVIGSGALLGIALLAAAGLFGCWLIGTRSLDIGTDTRTYAGFFLGLDGGLQETRLEPGFVFVSYALRRLGFGVSGYQAALFAVLLGGMLAAAYRYSRYLGSDRGRVTLLCASLMLLYVSPMFVNASINAVRQGLAAPLVFLSLLSFQQRKWWQFALWGALASSLHFSSLLYLPFAPLLLFNSRWLRYLAALALLLYCSGASMALVGALLPSLYGTVMEYTANTNYRSGVRIDFAVFSIFWYALPHLLAPLVQAPYRDRIKDSTAIYLVMLLPFFAIGWGYFSNRYLLPAWLSVSLILAAILCHCRIAPLRNQLTIGAGLIVACVVFHVFVTNIVVI